MAQCTYHYAVMAIMITLELDLQESCAFRVDCDYSRVRFTRILCKYSISVD